MSIEDAAIAEASQTSAKPDGNASVLATARHYTGRGWSVIPIPHKSKSPVFNDWPQMRLGADDLSSHFNGRPQNIGVLLGEPSGWLIDVDLDHLRAIEIAPDYLPPTPAVYGRASKPHSHWIYRSTSPAVTKKFKSKSAGMIIEFRSTGCQTVFPPSVHECGEAIEWIDPLAEPAEIDPDLLLERVKQIADIVKVELGEKQPPRLKKTPTKTSDTHTVAEPRPAEERVQRCLAAMGRLSMADGGDGSFRLFAAACRVVEHDLDDTHGIQVIRDYARQRPFPSSWTDDEILKRIRDAEKRCQRGAAFERDADGLIPLGGRDPVSGKRVLSPKRTLPTAEAFIGDFHLHAFGRTFYCYAGLLLEWRDNRYVEVEENAVRRRLQAWLHDALRYVFDRSTHEMTLAPFESNPTSVKAALESIRAYTHLDASVVSPSWLGSEPRGLAANDILPCPSTLLHLPTMTRHSPTPQFFTVNSLEVDPDPSAPPPLEWLKFLHQLFDGDIESLDLLQEWFGYCLTGNTSQQKMLLVVGPKRSGKGTIARVLTKLIGTGNVCGPTTSSLAGAFGLQPLIGKTLAIVSDARFSGDSIATVVERLLCISGEDTLTVDRKHMTSVTMKLPTRFVFLSNELPRLNDASGALSGRFVILRLSETFFGKEDTGLTQRLVAELPGILNWSIEGWQRLHDRGHFVMPSSVEDVVREIEELASPVSTFVRDCCHVGAGCRVEVDAIFLEWSRWCVRQGRDRFGTKQSFGRDLAAAVAGVRRKRGTNQVPFYEGITLQ